MTLATVSVNACIALGIVVLEAVKVSAYGDPAAVPDAGVPESKPALNVTPVGSDPLVRAMPGFGVPVAVTLNVPKESTVNDVAFVLVIAGGSGVAVGVTMTVPDTLLVNPA